MRQASANVVALALPSRVEAESAIGPTPAITASAAQGARLASSGVPYVVLAGAVPSSTVPSIGVGSSETIPALFLPALPAAVAAPAASSTTLRLAPALVLQVVGPTA